VAFVTVEEVATRLGWPLTPDEQARVQAFIDDCTVLIEEYCGKDFERRENESFQLPAVAGCKLAIPRRYLPYLTVASVAFEDGVPLTGWTYRDQALWRDAGWAGGQLVTVTGSWGYTTLPAALKVATAAEVIRWMARTPGLSMERTGEREVEYDASTPQSLSEVACRALRRYRPSVGVLPLAREG
jgi:hypothetical protein